jgi:N6-adenosine-specific RNA methylase IME4
MKYATIVADPPWNTKNGPIRGAARHFVGAGKNQPLPYARMHVDEIAALPVQDIAQADAALYLWTINGYVEAAYQVARAWGFKPSTLLTWCKTPLGGGLGGAFGITSEYVLYARRGSPIQRRTTGTWFQWKRRYDVRGHLQHSAKPDHFYDLVEQVSSPPYVDLFARRHRLGWDVWGDESANTAVFG